MAFANVRGAMREFRVIVVPYELGRLRGDLDASAFE